MSDHDPVVIRFNPLLGDFTDDGVLDARDRTALLGPSNTGTAVTGAIDRRMDLKQDGVVTQEDFLIWQQLFIAWKQSRKSVRVWIRFYFFSPHGAHML